MALIEALAVLGLILPVMLRLPPKTVTVAALVLLVVLIVTLGLDLATGSIGNQRDLPDFIQRSNRRDGNSPRTKSGFSNLFLPLQAASFVGSDPMFLSM